MTKEEIKVAYLEWIKDYCNIKQLDHDDLPGGIKLALSELQKLDPLDFRITSEKIADLGQTYSNDGNIPKYIYNYLAPYRKIRFL